MSGSIAAIAAYDGTGTQGYGTTDKNLPGVKSIFWNENDTDKYYVNGSSFSEVPANKNTIKTPETIVFTLDNDSDAVSDLTLLVETPGVFAPMSSCPPWVLAYLIERVEICVGNQVISTITTAGLIYDILRDSNKGLSVGIFHEGQMIPLFQGPITGSFSTTFNLNAFNTFKDGLNCSYLMACANNQTLQVKVYPFNLGNSDLNAYAGPSIVSAQTTSGDDDYTFRLFCKKSTMTNAERNFLRNQVLPKRTNITQISSRLSVTSLSDLNAATQITIYCDTFNINAEAIYIIAAQANVINYGIDAELYLNSTSYSGIIPPQIMQQKNELTMIATDSHWQPATPSRASFLCYKIPLGNSDITDQDFVPLNRYDSIRVVITPSNAGNTTGAPRTFTDLAPDNSFYETLSVVAVGKCTGLYQNGAVTFNNY